jgi:hypothetical protein
MAAAQELTKFFSDDEKKTATIYRVVEEPKHYLVSAINESGSSFQAIFDNQQDAEHFAEDWVLVK